ncbi:unnamed protein product [Musa hybrid cultivar]
MKEWPSSSRTSCAQDKQNCWHISQTRFQSGSHNFSPAAWGNTLLS